MSSPEAPLPAAVELRAEASWRCVDLISDLHLCDALPRTFAAWAAHMRSSRADAVLILGDLFEFWPGDDALQLPFERRCFEVLADAARSRWVGVMVGNRDFLLSPTLLQQHGLHAIADPTLLAAFGQRLLLSHGDALCLSDVAYQQFRRWVRDPATQRGFLARPLGERVAVGAEVRRASGAGRRQASPTEGCGDVDADAAVACLRAANATRLVHGHTHRPGDSLLAPGFDRCVLSDWDLDDASPRAQVLRLSAGGLERIAPEGSGTAAG